MKTTLRFSTGLALTASSNPMLRVFRANSCYDPDYTGVGTQPTGFDELSALYTYYRVHAITATAIARSENETATIPLNHAWVFKSGTSSTSLVDSIGNPFSKVGAVPTSSGGFVGKLVTKLKIRDFFGVDQKVYASDDYAALVSANPLKPCYLHYISQDTTEDGSALASNVLFYLDFEVEFYERVPLSRS
jgi:hypothetical protein